MLLSRDHLVSHYFAVMLQHPPWGTLQRRHLCSRENDIYRISSGSSLNTTSYHSQILVVKLDDILFDVVDFFLHKLRPPNDISLL